MRHLRPLDKALLISFVPLWVACLSLSTRAALRRDGYRSIAVSRPAGETEYPELIGFVAHAGAEGCGLRAGDRLLSLGGMDLRGVGPVGVAIRFARERAGAHLPVTFERAGGRGEASLPVASHALFWPRLPASVVFAATAVFLLLRAAPTVMVRTFVYSYMCVALLLACMFSGDAGLTATSIAVHVGSLLFVGPLVVRGALLFPHGAAPSGRWMRLAPWPFALFAPLDASRFYGFPLPQATGAAGMSLASVAIGAVLLHIITRTYRRSDPIGRRQLKWFLLGLYSALGIPVTAGALAAMDPRFAYAELVGVSALALIPLSVIVSVARYNLFDIDRLISATASYSILGVLLLAGLLTAVPQLARALGESSGLDPSAAQLLLSLVLAAAVVWAHGRLRPSVERLFFPERQALEQKFEQLLIELSRSGTPRQLTELVGSRLDALLRPESCVVYARGERAYSPVFARGPAVPAELGAESSLVALLERQIAPLAGDRLAACRGTLAPLDQALLDTLAAAVFLPVRREPALVAFACLGAKRSGDIYTAGELAMLAALADKVSGELLRYDLAEIAEQARAMQDTLRRYVPGALAEQMARGRDLDIGEREVSVLFVDIRGYSTYAEGRRAEEIFSTVSLYTRTVSEIVRACGGSVVEFNGDGMMAVFGAPERLADKERAAVEAGRRIVEAVSALPVETSAGGGSLSVGVGIATGPAFVGNIQAADRFIWTALGNTTNLAARLQSLTRDWHAAIVIDARTWSKAGPAATGFTARERTPIRGRTELEDLYALAAASANARLSEPRAGTVAGDA